jgi:large-conductance mechanosensitive channel
MRNLVTEFRQFILRGNVVDLAVGIVIGVAELTTGSRGTPSPPGR